MGQGNIQVIGHCVESHAEGALVCHPCGLALSAWARCLGEDKADLHGPVGQSLEGDIGGNLHEVIKHAVG